jgi:hypothetical protein
LCYALVIAVEDVRDNHFVQRSGSVIYLPNLQIAHYLRQISCRNLIEFWIIGDVYGQEFAKVFIEQAEKAGIDVFSVSFDLTTSNMQEMLSAS